MEVVKIKNSTKNSVLFILITITNFIIAYLITTLFNIKNTPIFPSLGIITEDMTYEVLIWSVLTLLDAFILEYSYVQKYKKDNHIIGSYWSVLKHIEIEEQTKKEGTDN